jgi:cell division protein FtsQ
MSAAPRTLRQRILPGIAAAAVAGAIAGGAWYGYGYVVAQPIERVIFSGDLRKLAPKDLEAFAQSVRGAASTAASLAAIREAARRVPWVREATVRRHFPDAIEVSFETHEVLARWGEGSLLSVRGDVFSAEHKGFLPVFRGPEGSGALMAAEYPRIVAALAPLASAVTELRYTPRAAWQVALESGLTLELGRGDIHPRLARFAAAWPQLDAQGASAKHADLRYANGFALRHPLPDGAKTR